MPIRRYTQLGVKKIADGFKNWKIVRGDKVAIISGKDKGETGTVTRVMRKNETVIVEGKNMVKKHVRPQGEMKEGQVVNKSMPIHVSNVALICPKTNQPTRVTMAWDAEGNKVRVAKRSGAVIPKPEAWKETVQKRNEELSKEYTWSSKVTAPDVAAKKTLEES